MDDNHSSEREEALCLQCLKPLPERAHFCPHCNAPQTFYAATAPFESTLTQGHAYRRAMANPRNLIVVVGVWLIFGPLFVTDLIWMRELASGIRELTWGQVPLYALVVAICGGAMWVTGTIIYRTTDGYLQQRRAKLDAIEDSDED